MPDSSHPLNKPPVNRPTPEDVARCHAAGMSKNRTAETLGVSTRQVGYVADELGLSWSATSTAEAVAARKQRSELERLDIADSWRELARDSIDRALAEDDPSDRRRHALTAEAATRADLSIWKGVEPESEGDEAKQAFAALLVSLRSSFRTLDDTPVEELDPDGEFDGPEVDEPP